MPMNRVPIADVVTAVREHTSLLLGLTIGFSDEDWAAPTALQGWTRSHVAAHLVDGAECLARAIEGLDSASPRPLHSTVDEERVSVEVGALASGLDLQISLDTSASRLQNLFPAVEDVTTLVEPRPGMRLEARQIPLLRLREVVLHHLDLQRDAEIVLDPEISVALLAHEVRRYSLRAKRAAVRVVSDEGYEGVVEGADDGAEVRGPARDLFLWLGRGIQSPSLILTGS